MPRSHRDDSNDCSSANPAHLTTPFCRHAATEAVGRCHKSLTYMLRRLTGDAALSDDLCQEALCVALEKLQAGKIEDSSRLPGFLRSTARNLYLNEVHKTRRRRRSGEVPIDASVDGPTLLEVADGSSSPLDQLLLEEARARVRRGLSELPNERDRRVLVQVYLSQNDKPEVCAAMGVSPNQLNVMLFRARRRLKALLISPDLTSPDLTAPDLASSDLTSSDSAPCDRAA
ncbi:MAG: sigma-70 family RNA polymerase sigma factor [Acidobacteriota bacterium]